MTNSLSQESYSKQSVAFIRSDLIEYRTTKATKINIVYIDQDGYSSCIQSGQNLFVYFVTIAFKNKTSFLDVYALTWLQNKPKNFHESISFRHHFISINSVIKVNLHLK